MSCRITKSRKKRKTEIESGKLVGKKWIKTGIPGFAKLLKKGIPRGSSHSPHVVPFDITNDGIDVKTEDKSLEVAIRRAPIAGYNK